MQRVLAIYIPFLSTDRLCEQRERNVETSKRRNVETNRDEGTEGHRDGVNDSSSSLRPLVPSSLSPIGTITPQGQTIRIVHLNRAAKEAYLRSGQTLAEAKAVVPDLVTFPDDPAADRICLENLALWAQCLSPTVHIEGEDTLLLDVTGSERLFCGEKNLLREAVDGLGAQGFTSRGAIADTPGAAWALAHAHDDPVLVAEPGSDIAQLAPLPVWSLRVEKKTVDALRSVGVETVESLLHLPRSSLASRFGQRVLDRLDQALGNLPEVLTPYQPEPVMVSRLSFGGTTDRLEVLLEAVRQAVTGFCEQLNRKTAGVRQAFVTFYSPDVPGEKGAVTQRTTLSVSLSHATRSAGHLLTLLKVRLEGLRLPGPADAIAVWARQVEPLDDCQIEFFDTGRRHEKSLGDLLDRLIVRLGYESVVRPRLLSDHQPEKAFRYVPVIKIREKATKRRSDEGEEEKTHHARNRDAESGPFPPPLMILSFFPSSLRRFVASSLSFHPYRPLRLPAPLAIAATSLVPDGPPVAFELQGHQSRIMDCVGPERIETGWWRGQHVQRDYFRVSIDSGRRCWLFRARDTGQWFLHGWFD